MFKNCGLGDQGYLVAVKCSALVQIHCRTAISFGAAPCAVPVTALIHNTTADYCRFENSHENK